MAHYDGSSRRFDATWNPDYWGKDTTTGVANITGGFGQLPAMEDASTGVVHMYHPTGWGGWQFQVGARSDPDSLQFLCHGFKDSSAPADTKPDWVGPCNTEPKGLATVVVQGGYQEARGTAGAGVGAFYVENIKELLDSEREWFLDEATSTLFYMPSSPAAPPSKSAFVGATGKSVFEVRGAVGQPVSEVSITGVTITQTATTFLEKYEVPSGGDWSLYRGAAVFVSGPADSITVQGCLFDQPGGNALMLSNAVSNSLVANNSFVDVGDSAMLAVGSARLLDATAANSDPVGAGMPTNNLLTRNLVDNVGIFGKQTSAYFKALCRANTFSENVLMNGPRAGVNFNDGAAGGEVLEGNLFFNFVRESGDHGMFNSWDRQPYLYEQDGAPTITPQPHQMRRNFCLNANFATTHLTKSGYCFDHDDGSAQYNSSDNVCFAGGFKLRDGVNRWQTDNLVVEGKLADPQINGFKSTILAGNTVVDSSGMFYSCVKDAFGGGMNVTNNRYFVPGAGAVPKFNPNCEGSCGTLECWQKLGYDAGSTISADITVADVLGWAREKLRM